MKPQQEEDLMLLLIATICIAVFSCCLVWVSRM